MIPSAHFARGGDADLASTALGGLAKGLPDLADEEAVEQGASLPHRLAH